MSTKAFRSAVNTELVAWAAANFPTVPVFYENGPVPDEDKVGPVFIDVELRWYGARELGLGSLPLSGRHSGALSVSVYYRSAQGTGQADDIIDSCAAYMKARRVGGGHLRQPQRTVPTHLKGWYKTGILLPFTLDV